MKLTVRERLLMAMFFPKKGSMRELRISKDIGRKVALGDEEQKEIEFVVAEKSIKWNAAKAKEIEIELNDDEREFLKRQITRLDEEEEYTQDLLELADRIKEL